MRSAHPDMATAAPSYEGLVRLGHAVIEMIQEDVRYLLTTFKSVASLPALLGTLYIDKLGRYAQELLARGQVPFVFVFAFVFV